MPADKTFSFCSPAVGKQKRSHRKNRNKNHEDQQVDISEPFELQRDPGHDSQGYKIGSNNQDSKGIIKKLV